MTLPVSGAISFNNINVELGVAGTTQASLGQASYRTLAGVASGAISMSNFYGKSNRVSSSITISANTTNYTLNTGKVTGYVAGKTDVTLTINSGVYVYSTSTGTYALTVTGWTTGDTVSIINNGVILGRGGDGGTYGQYVGKSLTGGGTGGTGGPAFFTNYPTTFTNNNRIAGGGGGGGGSGMFRQNAYTFLGAGGGGGIGNGAGASAPNWGKYSGSGSSGTLTTAGTGGRGFGTYAGDGGGYGSAGSAGRIDPAAFGSMYSPNGPGGAAGGAVAGNSLITWVATGTRNGSIT